MRAPRGCARLAEGRWIRFGASVPVVLAVAALMLPACASKTPPPAQENVQAQADLDLGVDPAELTPAIDNPYAPFGSLRQVVFEGSDLEPETKETVPVRVVSTVRDTPETVAGVRALVVDVSDFEDGELVERTQDYYAQDRSGAVYYLGERVDDLEGGKVVGHGGQWMAGENGNRAGVFMPADPKTGDTFEQERAPGIAEDRSTVLATGVTITVPAGTFTDCVETEDYDPVGKTKMRKTYCRGIGLVQEDYGEGHSIKLVSIERR